MIDRLFLILIPLGFGLYVGPLPVSEYALWLYAIIHVSNIKGFYLNKRMRLVGQIFISLFVLQICIDLFIFHIEYYPFLKGADTILMCAIYTFYLYKEFQKNKNNVIYFLIGVILQLTFFHKSLYEADGTYAEALLGENAAFLKMVIAPIISYALLILCYIYKRSSIVGIVFVGVGILFIIAGARNAGLTLIVSYLISKINRYRLFRDHLTLSILTLCLVGYGMYCIYVHNVLNGKISSGNNTVLLKVENPYNPISLLLISRTETYIGVMAMIESPIIGHSTLMPDYGNVYRKARDYFIEGEDYNITNNSSSGEIGIIPCHSIIVGFGAQYGIIGLMLAIVFFSFFFRNAYTVIKQKPDYKLLLSYCLASLLWNSLFSPMGHFKWNMPFYFAIILLMHNKLKNQNHYDKPYYIGCYSNLRR